MLKVAIATTSPEKIAGVKMAVLRFFNLEEPEVEFNCMSTNSGVSDQPFGDETYEGAQNRVCGIREKFQKPAWT